ncbi:MAG: Asp-tRNA(Asn)/Glu-tRNA(Gln) amidotransferase subunit GatC [Lachnospiraceae bacterium]|nr:Asp-tRNA(Asn)/Glu-tRNA(Gln) amidotransferase subunit GatC [Lachnospiraceae bacterium]
MQRIDEETMERVELLAKLSLSEEERACTMAELEKLLAYMDELKELDTEHVDALVHVLGQVNVFREDEVTNTDGSKMLLKNAPKSKAGQLVVPKTI